MSNYLYLIRSGEWFKIGIASDVEYRLAQLQTGNPEVLVIEHCYEFDNASIIEQALHQTFKEKRGSGEWFKLDQNDVYKFTVLCVAMNGTKSDTSNIIASDDEVEAAESSESIAKFDFEKMFADGWRMERNTNGKHVGQPGKYWCWRRGSGIGKGYIYGGSLESLPYPIEQMRAMYDKDLQPVVDTGSVMASRD